MSAVPFLDFTPTDAGLLVRVKNFTSLFFSHVLVAAAIIFLN